MALMFIMGFIAVTAIVTVLMATLPEQPQYAIIAAGVGYMTLVTTAIIHVVKIILLI